jgi:hypothetical protein
MPVILDALPGARTRLDKARAEIERREGIPLDEL